MLRRESLAFTQWFPDVGFENVHYVYAHALLPAISNLRAKPPVSALHDVQETVKPGGSKHFPRHTVCRRFTDPVAEAQLMQQLVSPRLLKG